jgi:hypothetical protein
MSTQDTDPSEFHTDTLDPQTYTDADSMRREFGIAPYDAEAFDYPNVVPNALEHTWDAGPDQDGGGTDFLATGKPGCGKSTLAINWVVRLLEVNEEKVVWRGSPSRSEWLPLAPWTTVLLPRGVDVSAELVPKNPAEDTIAVELENMVREVKRYADPDHVNEMLLEPGQFHVLYPDPEMKGCQEVYERSQKVYESPPNRDAFFAAEDPLTHWWFAYILSRVENGPYDFTSLVLDEIGDIAPDTARADKFAHHQKVEMLRDAFVDARKYGLSLFAFGHSESDIHHYVRQKIRWRISMPGNANPVSKNDVVGMDAVPMDVEMTSRFPLGTCLMFTERNFEHRVKWSDIPDPHDRELAIQLEGRS